MRGSEPTQIEASSGYADETELHGLRQALKAEGKVEKACWAVTLTLAFVFVVKGSVTTLVRFSEQPTATQVSVTKIEHFPSVLLCHWYWIDESRLKEFGFTEAHLDSIGRIFPVPVGFMLNEKNATRDQAFVSAIKDYELDTFLTTIAYPPEEIIPVHRPYIVEATGQLSLWLTTMIPCYKLDINMSINPFVAGMAYYEITIRNTKPAFGRTGKYDSDMLYVGESATSIIPENGVPIVPGMLTSATITSSRCTRLNRRKFKCDENASFNRSACFAAEINRICQKEGRKPYYIPRVGYKIRDISTYMSHENAEKNCDIILGTDTTWQDEVGDHCPPPCDSWFYHMTVAPISAQMGMDGALVIGLRYPLEVMHLKEHFEITLDSFLSSIGGCWGLWSGASFISFVHMLLFCLFRNRKALEDNSGGRDRNM